MKITKSTRGRERERESKRCWDNSKIRPYQELNSALAYTKSLSQFGRVKNLINLMRYQRPTLTGLCLLVEVIELTDGGSDRA
jgi:hypothetical protein